MDREITVILTLYKTPYNLLYSLRQYKKYKVIIFEQAPNKDSKKKIEKISNIKFDYYSSKKNIGLPKASNFLLSKVQTRYLLFTQADIKIDNKSIINLKKSFKVNKNVILSSPTYSKKRTKIKKSLLKNYIEKTRLNMACVLCDTKKLKKIGFFDEDFFLYWEDVFLMKKINFSKFKMIQVLDSYAVHSGSKSSIKDYKVNFIRNSNFKYGEFLFDFKTRKFRSLKMIRQIIQNILYSFINLLFFKKESLLKNLSNIYGIYKFIIFFLIRDK